MHEKMGTLELEDRDQIQNKEPIFSLQGDINRMFSVEPSPTKDANLMLSKVQCRNHTVAVESNTFSSFLVPFEKAPTTSCLTFSSCTPSFRRIYTKL